LLVKDTHICIYTHKFKIQLQNRKTSTNKSAKTSTCELKGKGLKLGGVSQ
jgi:hypothetical protein